MPKIWKMSDTSKPSPSDSSESPSPKDDGFPRGWAGHEEDQRAAWLRLSYVERLRWLEQAKAFVAAQAARGQK